MSKVALIVAMSLNQWWGHVLQEKAMSMVARPEPQEEFVIGGYL